MKKIYWAFFVFALFFGSAGIYTGKILESYPLGALGGFLVGVSVAAMIFNTEIIIDFTNKEVSVELKTKA